MSKSHPMIRVVLFALLVTRSFSAEPIMSPDDLSAFVQGYYLQPKPERIANAIASLGPSGYVQQPAWGFAAFFSEVFAAHPRQLAKWKKLIGRQDKAVRDFLQYALNLSQTGGTLAMQEHTPVMNDMHWGAFFATGNPAHVRRLIAELKYCDERQDRKLYMTGATAKWSLLSNAETHSLVRKTLEEAGKDADPRTRDILAVMLQQSAEDARREIRETVAQQKAAGIWQ